MTAPKILEDLAGIARRVQQDFEEGRRVLSYAEYLELLALDPVRHTRDASRYVRDTFLHYGKVEIERPWGPLTRYRLFDLPFAPQEDARRDALVAHESVQGELFRVLANFAREGRANRVVLLHGPNGSAKSTAAACVMRALEHYSSLDEGALYRFHWVFPNQGKLKGSIGFSGRKASRQDDDSYAHLPEGQVDARLFMEVRDHPLFLLPEVERRELLFRLYEEAKADEPPPSWMLRGSLSHKSRQVFDALLASYDGSLAEVLRHVQVERYFISRRYRVGAVTLGPELSVDAGERQLTADRSVAALPSSLQAVTLFEAFGELVDAAGGVLEFSDLLKRPLDAFKYLQITAETGEVGLRSQSVQVNCVMLASGNELHLAAFREHPEFDSFRGRLELVTMPYLRSWLDEKLIYDAQVAEHASTHIAPHATELAAQFAVLTRMRKPNADRYEKPLKDLVSELTALEKMDLYATGTPPSRLEHESSRLLRSAIVAIYTESDAYPIYEGSLGASPREMRTLLLDAAQNPNYSGLSPLGVLDALDRLCERTVEYGWLTEDKSGGGYHDHKHFREALRSRLLDTFEDEMRAASGLVDEARYSELFDHYISHVSYWAKQEKVRNPLTGQYEDPDERMMQEVEALLGEADKPETLRDSLLNRVAAWAIDNPGIPVDNRVVFAPQLKRIRDAVFAERRVLVARLTRDIKRLLREEGEGLDAAHREGAKRAVAQMIERFGYQESSVADAAVVLVRERFADLLN